MTAYFKHLVENKYVKEGVIVKVNDKKIAQIYRQLPEFWCEVGSIQG